MVTSAVGRNSSPIFESGELRGKTIFRPLYSKAYPVDNLPPQVSPLRGRGIIKPASANVKPLRCAPDGAALRGFPADASEGEKLGEEQGN